MPIYIERNVYFRPPPPSLNLGPCVIAGCYAVKTSLLLAAWVGWSRVLYFAESVFKVQSSWRGLGSWLQPFMALSVPLSQSRSWPCHSKTGAYLILQLGGCCGLGLALLSNPAAWEPLLFCDWEVLWFVGAVGGSYLEAHRKFSSPHGAMNARQCTACSVRIHCTSNFFLSWLSGRGWMN